MFAKLKHRVHNGAAPYKIGRVVYTRKRYWRERGKTEQLMTRIPHPWVGEPMRLVVHRVLMNCNCDDCDAPILQEQLYATRNHRGTQLHFCLACVVPRSEQLEAQYAKEYP